MKVLSSFRDLVSSRKAADPPEPSGDQPDPPAGSDLPFPGYDRLDAKQAAGVLAKHSQAELEAVETYERSHEGRERVLDKLRYMRGSEPIPGYDVMEAEEIVSVLGEADMATTRRIRVYERKFGNRKIVLDEVDRSRLREQAAHPRARGPRIKPLPVKHKPSRHGPGGVRRDRG